MLHFYTPYIVAGPESSKTVDSAMKILFWGFPSRICSSKTKQKIEVTETATYFLGITRGPKSVITVLSYARK